MSPRANRSSSSSRAGRGESLDVVVACHCLTAQTTRIPKVIQKVSTQSSHIPTMPRADITAMHLLSIRSLCLQDGLRLTSFTVLMCADCQAARGHGTGPYPVMTRAEMRAGLDMLPTLGR